MTGQATVDWQIPAADVRVTGSFDYVYLLETGIMVQLSSSRRD